MSTRLSFGLVGGAVQDFAQFCGKRVDRERFMDERDARFQHSVSYDDLVGITGHVKRPARKFSAFQVQGQLATADPRHHSMADAAATETTGPGFWCATQDRLGFGTTKISAQAKRRLEAANPGRTLKNNSFTAVDIDIDMTLGLFWNFKIKQLIFSLGAGYNASGMLLGDVSYNYKENNMYASPDSMVYRKGTIFKALIKW